MRFAKNLIFKTYLYLLRQPLKTLALMALLCIGAAYYAKDFSYDSSSDALVAQDDPELLYYNDISQHFGEKSFLFLTYMPRQGTLFQPEILAHIDELAQKLRAIEGVSNVTTILEAPLLKSPPVPVTELASGYNTLKSPTVDMTAARLELTTSPIFRDLLISADGRTTALRIGLTPDEHLEALARERARLRRVAHRTDAEEAALDKLEYDYRQAHMAYSRDRDVLIDNIRAVRDSALDKAVVYLGGVPMVASDMIRYVQADIIVFGSTSAVVMMGLMMIFFRRIRWVALPVVNAGVSVLLTVGLLGFFNQPVTVISSNFISLLVIFSISFSVHLIVKYHELLRKNPKKTHKQLVYETFTDKLEPGVYSALTTIVAFASLTTSSIIPVIDFGWVMCGAIGVAFVVCYTLFPALLLMMEKGNTRLTPEKTPAMTTAMAKTSTKNAGLLIAFSLLLAVFGAVGVSRLSLDSRFIEYFKQRTEIYQGLAFIDRYLGGTIPMEIILHFPPYEAQEVAEDDDFFTAEEDPFPQRYWFTPDKVELLHKYHDYLATRPEVGKVLSLATLEQVARDFNDGKPLGAVELVAVLGAVPADIRHEFIAPYAAPEAGIMRISTRIHETGPMYPRNRLIEEIHAYGVQTLNLAPENVHVTGINVLFNGMLMDLFTSQTSTLIFVIVATLLMFTILLRSLSLAVLGLIPNVLAAALVLALMGFVGIPMDMMTITIASIVIGIGVDDAIHYLHHFKQGYAPGKNVKDVVKDSHRNVGSAMYITSITVVTGFLILVFSEFIPTVYFGILTALAMVLALFANLSLLPALLVKFYK